MGIISVNKLKLPAYHGVYEQERKVGNIFVVSVHLDVPMSEEAMKSDSIDDTLNYADVVDVIKREMSTPSQLLEHVAGRIKNRLLTKFPGMIASGEITIEKLAPPVPAELESVAFTAKW